MSFINPKTQFQTIYDSIPASNRLEACAEGIEECRKQTLHDLGVDKPSNTLIQVTRADAVNCWVKGQSTGGEAMSNKYYNHGKWPTGNQLLDNPNLELMCGDAADLSVYM